MKVKCPKCNSEQNIDIPKGDIITGAKCSCGGKLLITPDKEIKLIKEK